MDIGIEFSDSSGSDFDFSKEYAGLKRSLFSSSEEEALESLGLAKKKVLKKKMKRVVPGI